MRSRLAPALLAPLLLLLTGCSLTRSIGLGPDHGPYEVRPDDTPEQIYERAEAAFAAQEWEAAAEAFEKLWENHPTSPLAADAQFYEAESKYGGQNFNAAFERYRRFIGEHPLSPHAPLLQRRLYDIGVYLIEAGQEGHLGIFEYAGEGVDVLEFLVDAFPHGDLADQALLYMADYEARDHKTLDAINHLLDLLEEYPQSEYALEARLRLARAYQDVNRGTSYDEDALLRAVAEFRTYIEIVTRDAALSAEHAADLELARAGLAESLSTLAEKQLETADYYLRTGNPEAAQAVLQRLVEDYPDSGPADEARRRLGRDEGAE